MSPSSRAHVPGMQAWVVMLMSAAACHTSSASQAPSPTAAYEPKRHFSGVDVIRTNRGGVLIRVISGLVGDNPLYVVDGTPVMVDPKRGLDWLSPEQIARVEVLRLPAETAIYGPRGANGVILVTTTRGR